MSSLTASQEVVYLKELEENWPEPTHIPDWLAAGLRKPYAVPIDNYLRNVLASSTSDAGTIVYGTTYRLCVEVATDPILLGSVTWAPALSIPFEYNIPTLIDSTQKSVKEAIYYIKSLTGLADNDIGKLVGVSRQTINNWENGTPIKDSNLKRLLAVCDVLRRAAASNPKDSRLLLWLNRPRGSEGITPAALIAAGEIDRARLLAVSVPSPRLNRPPVWINRAIPETLLSPLLPGEETSLSEDDEEYDFFGVTKGNQE